jgi:alkylated DNA repair dioxygenase AlkB
MTTTSGTPVVADFSDCSNFLYTRNFLQSDQAFLLLEKFYAELKWQQQEIRIFGRNVRQPRLSCWYGDKGARYTYSGLHLEPLPWHSDLLDLRHRLQETLHHPFNSVLANAYRDGRDSMGWHADDEKELGDDPVIASLSLGACRRFRWRALHGNETRVLPLEHGSLLLMRGNFQTKYQHSLPKTTKSVGLRINLTFRHIEVPRSQRSNILAPEKMGR